LANATPLLPFVAAKFWHATCDKTGMAKKTMTLKAPPEIRGTAAVNNRQLLPPTTALYLSQLLGQLRPHGFKILPSGMRRQIPVQIEEHSQTPRVVKIIHAGSI
jgi:hypothetical protein